MANAANKDRVAADMRPTDYRGALKRLETIDNKKKKQQAAAKEIGDIYTAAEAICGVDKKASKIFMILRGLEDAEFLRTFRDLNGLLDAAGRATESADLVDKANGLSVNLRLVSSAEPRVEDDGDEDGDGSVEDELHELADDGEKPAEHDDFEEATDEELKQQEGRGATTAAKSRAKKAFGDGPALEPYTGDNSDLAGEE